MTKQKITPFLWFDKGKVREAAEYYISVFKDARFKDSYTVKNTPSGDVEVVSIVLFGQDFILMGAGPEFKFDEAVSFYISCKNQEEIDYYWEKLTANGGQESNCGWVKDRFGLSWQIQPKNMDELVKTSEGTKAMLKMKKIIIKDLEKVGEEK
jgi:predicted 3-demethylubiquinone-9 3-methyltransferase (glyoxalase superfamily)